MPLIFILDSVPWAGSKTIEYGADITLIIMALVVVTIIVGKLLRLRRAKISSNEYKLKVVELFRKGRWNDALDLSNTYAKDSHIAHVMYVGLCERNSYGGELSEEQLPKHMEQAMGRVITLLQYNYGKHLGILDAIAFTSPFFGVLGGTPYTLAFGTILAVPSIWFATYLRNKTLWLEVEMKNSASELTSFIEARPRGYTPEATAGHQ
jgi:biopolymer transport protein ExbB/TolQ